MPSTKQKTNPLTYKFKGKEVPLEDVISIEDEIWEKNGKRIITLSGLQKIAEKEKLVEKEFSVDIKPRKDNHQQHVVTIWLGEKGDTDKDNWKRGSGEASILNTGKLTRVQTTNAQGQQVTQLKADELGLIDSRYKFAMAEKRAYSRALMKCIQLYGIYCEVESTDFAQPEAKKANNFDL